MTQLPLALLPILLYMADKSEKKSENITAFEVNCEVQKPGFFCENNRRGEWPFAPTLAPQKPGFFSPPQKPGFFSPPQKPGFFSPRQLRYN